MEIKEEYTGIPYPLKKAQDEALKIKKELQEYGFQEKGGSSPSAEDIDEVSSLMEESSDIEKGVNVEDLINYSPEEILRMRDDELENLHSAINKELIKQIQGSDAATTKNLETLSKKYQSLSAGAKKTTNFKEYSLTIIADLQRKLASHYDQHKVEENEKSAMPEARQMSQIAKDELLGSQKSENSALIEMAFSENSNRRPLRPYTSEDITRMLQYKNDKEKFTELSKENQALLARILKLNTILDMQWNIFLPDLYNFKERNLSYDDIFTKVDIIADLIKPWGEKIPLLLIDITHATTESILKDKLRFNAENPMRKLKYPAHVSIENRIGIPVVLGIEFHEQMERIRTDSAKKYLNGLSLMLNLDDMAERWIRYILEQIAYYHDRLQTAKGEDKNKIKNSLKRYGITEEEAEQGYLDFIEFAFPKIKGSELYNPNPDYSDPFLALANPLT